MGDFHFLRPAWLLALLPIAALVWLHHRRRASSRAAGGVIAPHLLKHLTVGGGDATRTGPMALSATVAALMAFALAGPAWEREPSPFADDQAALVIAIDASRTMNCIDVAPTRLERAKQKVRDLLARRPGAKTALVAYAGSAHLVLPLTEDRAILETYLDAIDTDLMPKAGKRADLAIAAALEVLERQKASGSILLLTDAHDVAGDELVLAVGTARGGPVRTKEKLDTVNVAPPVAVAGGIELTADDADVRRLAARAERSLVNVAAAGARWKDFGYILVFPCLLLAALWFRRGWIVRWTLALPLIVFVPACGADAWWTADQQARRLFEAGEFAAAAEQFEDPHWRGIALYRAGRYEDALTAFALAGAHFNRGNCSVKLKRYDDAIAAYDEVLRETPDDADAAFNRALALRLKHEEENEEAGEGTEEKPDDIKFDAKKKKGGKDTRIPRTLDEQTAELWMRQVQTTPADFLRLKFQFQENE